MTQEPVIMIRKVEDINKLDGWVIEHAWSEGMPPSFHMRVRHMAASNSVEVVVEPSLKIEIGGVAFNNRLPLLANLGFTIGTRDVKDK